MNPTEKEMHLELARLLMEYQRQVELMAHDKSKLATRQWNEYNGGSVIIQEGDLAEKLFGDTVLTYELYCAQHSCSQKAKMVHRQMLHAFEKPAADIPTAYAVFEAAFTAARGECEKYMAELRSKPTDEMIDLKEL
jgi:hypothetical protein